MTRQNIHGTGQDIPLDSVQLAAVLPALTQEVAARITAAVGLPARVLIYAVIPTGEVGSFSTFPTQADEDAFMREMAAQLEEGSYQQVD